MESLIPQVKPRICETPAFMFVEGFLFRRYSLYVYVPATTESFMLSVYDKPNNTGPESQPSFTMISPEGLQTRLSNPKKDEWSSHKFEVNAAWGVWQLRIEAGPSSCRNEFLVKTIGEVDLYAKPEPCVNYRGTLSLTGHGTNTESPHSFTMQVPNVSRLRLNFLLPTARITGDKSVMLILDGPPGIDWTERWVSMGRDRFAVREFWRLEYLEITGANLEGLWQLRLENVTGVYHLGIEQQVRLFFNKTPLMPPPQKTVINTSLPDGNPVSARIELNSPRMLREGYSGFPGTESPYTIFTNVDGTGDAFLLPDIDYTATISRGFSFEVDHKTIPANTTALESVLPHKIKPRPGWYGGDCHTHSVYSDGSFTPAQVVEGARAEGLDWVVLSDHGQGPDVPTIRRAHKEAIEAANSSGFLVIPGEEFSADSFHANIFNGIVDKQYSDSLQSVIDTVIDADTEQVPLTIGWNHPFGHGKDLVDENLVGLPLLEVWNTKLGDEEKSTIDLWWSWLIQGKRVFAETGTDNHHRVDNLYGHRRTYVYLKDQDLTANNVVKALSSGRSFVSRGALIYFTGNDAMPGDTTDSGDLDICVEVDSATPLVRVEIVGNGHVVHSFEIENVRQFSGITTIEDAKGWYLAQAFGSGDDTRPLAMTNPIFCVNQY